jgi:Methylase involved in ubiquinone/menaquinone biosynthesis
LTPEEVRFKKSKDLVRKRLVKYTRKAYRMLPPLHKPHILDVGCGSGVPTMELARLSNGEITGLDIDQNLLDVLAKKIEKAGLSDRVKAVKCSILDMNFPDESFDIIWSEGSIFVIGFERGLKEWWRFLKPDGFMVIHDEKGDITEKLEQVSRCGYELLGHFTLNEDTWRAEYFAPLEKLIGETQTKHTDNPKLLGELRSAQREIDMFKRNPEQNTSVCFVIRKKGYQREKS